MKQKYSIVGQSIGTFFKDFSNVGHIRFMNTTFACQLQQPGNERVQALAIRVRRYVVIATKPVY